jgi:hypothetical protein
MRSLVLAFMVVAVFAPVALAIPINHTASNGIAAVIVTDEGIPWLLRTNGEVWRFVDGQWLHPAPGYPNLDLPIGTLLDSIANVGDWQLWVLYRNDGAILYHGLGPGGEWGLLPAPPFSPVAAQQKSLGSAKQGYR